jgi:hypothetical protein
VIEKWGDSGWSGREEPDRGSEAVISPFFSIIGHPCLFDPLHNSISSHGEIDAAAPMAYIDDLIEGETHDPFHDNRMYPPRRKDGHRR